MFTLSRKPTKTQIENEKKKKCVDFYRRAHKMDSFALTTNKFEWFTHDTRLKIEILKRIGNHS